MSMHKNGMLTFGVRGKAELNQVLDDVTPFFIGTARRPPNQYTGAVVDSPAAASFSFMLMNSTHQVAQSPFRHRKVDFEDAENTADIPRIEMRTSIYTNTFTAKRSQNWVR